MTNRLTLIFVSLFFFTACTATNPAAVEEAFEKTVVSIVNQELKSTQIMASPTKSPTQVPTKTRTPLFTPTATLTFIPTTLSPSETPFSGYGPIDFPKEMNPLTGLLVEDGDKLNRRPISVKISNYPRGIRPQWGLSLADHVFEYYHEGGLTRFNAIFYANDASKIGPIRSGRFSDEDIVNMYGAFFAFASADWRVREVFYKSAFQDRMASLSDYPCPPTTKYPLCRIESENWNHLITNSKKLYDHFEIEDISSERQGLDGLVFNQEMPNNGISAKEIVVRFSRGSYHKWVFDGLRGSYIRYQDDIDADPGQEEFSIMTDDITKQSISADNIIILLANYRYYSVDPEMVDIDYDEGGLAYAFRDGVAYNLTWGRTEELDLIILYDQEGKFFQLKPGNTWFEILGSSSLIPEPNQDWVFQFKIP